MSRPKKVQKISKHVHTHTHGHTRTHTQSDTAAKNAGSEKAGMCNSDKTRTLLLRKRPVLPMGALKHVDFRGDIEVAEPVGETRVDHHVESLAVWTSGIHDHIAALYTHKTMDFLHKTNYFVIHRLAKKSILFEKPCAALRLQTAGTRDEVCKRVAMHKLRAKFADAR